MIIISGKQKVNLARGLNFLFFLLWSLTSQLYLYNAFIPFFKKREYIFVSGRKGDGVTDELHSTKTNLIYEVFSHDVTAAILVSQNNETAAMFVSQTNPVGAELFSYVNAFFVPINLHRCWPREWKNPIDLARAENEAPVYAF